MKNLGTIIATPKQMRDSDRHFDALKSKALKEAAVELAGLEKRTVSGEVRFYKTETIYTPAVKRGGVRRWFETRKDGDYAI